MIAYPEFPLKNTVVWSQYFSNFCDSEKKPEISEPPAEERHGKDLMTRH
jgi:hypothetical protein